jgi:aspartate aminotransferase-like enzyme
VDTVCTLGGVPFKADAWGAFSQDARLTFPRLCIAPAGSASVTVVTPSR